MAEARSREDWTRTAGIMALLANLHRDPRKRAAYKTADFHPQCRQRNQPVGRADVKVLKTVFVDRRQ